jgi:GMP synthase-like glutamine amidotransferase
MDRREPLFARGRGAAKAMGVTLAILEAGKPPGDLGLRFGDYPAMFEALLGRKAARYDVEAGIFPERPEAHEAYLITGAAAGVYDSLPWVAPLAGFLRDARGRAKLVGICFGHQIMAEAFGGHVEKSSRGWGAGLQTYRIFEHESWMDGEGAVAVPVSHQDQVVVQPPASRVVAGNDFSRFGMIAYDDQPAISMQCHPEFDPAFGKALIESRYDRVPDPEAAIASLDAPNDCARVGGWIRRFLAD